MGAPAVSMCLPFFVPQYSHCIPILSQDFAQSPATQSSHSIPVVYSTLPPPPLPDFLNTPSPMSGSC